MIYWLIELNSFVYIVIYRNQLDVAPLQNLFLLAVLKLDRKDSFGYSKEMEMLGETFPTILTYYINIA